MTHPADLPTIYLPDYAMAKGAVQLLHVVTVSGTQVSFYQRPDDTGFIAITNLKGRTKCLSFDADTWESIVT